LKYSKYIGLAAAFVLILACFLPWAHYPDIDKTFTGFFSEQNRYGKPGKLFVVLAIICSALFLVPKIWAQRLNMVMAVLTIAFAVRTYILFTACYRGICPEKQIGIFLLVGCSIIILLASVLPDMKLKEKGIKQK
jgi:hypothetical protein